MEVLPCASIPIVVIYYESLIKIDDSKNHDNFYSYYISELTIRANN